jgi:hypothetical protein
MEAENRGGQGLIWAAVPLDVWMDNMLILINYYNLGLKIEAPNL